MIVSLPIAAVSVRNAAVIVAIAVALVAATTLVVWSVLAPDPQLIAPTRWMEAARSLA